VRNASGEFVKADLDTVTAAAKSVAVPAGADWPVSIANAAGKRSYPITTFTWLLVPGENHDTAKKTALADLLHWILTAGQKQCAELGYAPLPSDVALCELRRLADFK
jgi:phosphate transport system substrate-binding protein